MKYSKTPVTSEEHCALLLERGLAIPDTKRAIKYLKTVGYYRLTGYMFHMQSRDGSHRFLEGASFDDVIGLYHFDKQLRGIIAGYFGRLWWLNFGKIISKFTLERPCEGFLMWGRPLS